MIILSLGKRIQERREQVGLSQTMLAKQLGVSQSAIGNYEVDTSFPKKEVMLRLFDCLQIDPNYLFQDSFQHRTPVLSTSEQALIRQYRSLSPLGRQTVRSVADALCDYRDELEIAQTEQEARTIPLYHTPAAAGYAAPTFGEDFDYISVTDEIPSTAEFAVRIQGDSMAPFIADNSVVYVNHDPLNNGDVGIFCVDSDILCKQYYKDTAGMVYLFSLNRARADADVLLTPNSGRSLFCIGRVIIHAPPLPGKL